jgi:acyl carrier protein
MLENPTDVELLEKVRIAFQSAFNIDPKLITIDTVPSDIPHWDSLGHVNLAVSLEQTFGLTLDVDDLMAMENVKEICRILHSRLGQVPR